MDVLVPIDGSDCSVRALQFATGFAERYGADLHIVHFSGSETDATDQILERAEEVLEGADVEDEPELVDADLNVRTENKVGKAILSLAEERGYDHVVMGHHGSGTVKRAILGSAAETVIRGGSVPTTVIP